MKKEFEISCSEDKEGVHNYGIIKRWFAQNWYYCPFCKTLFDENKLVRNPETTSKEILEVIPRLEKLMLPQKDKLNET